MLNGHPATDQRQKIVVGDIIQITVPQAQDSHIGPQNIPLDVVFEDDDLVVINKAVGMVGHLIEFGERLEFGEGPLQQDSR